MNRIFGIFIAFLLIPTLPAFGVSKTDAGRQRQEIETKYCIQIAGTGGGTLNCATQSLNCILGLKPAYTKEQVDKIVTEYCETIGFAAASATQNASSGLLLATPAQEDESQQKAGSMIADISGTIDTNDALLLGMTHLDVTPCTLRDSMSLTYQNFKKQITCPIGTKSMTITFTTTAPDYKIENPKHVISLSPEKQKYTLPETIKISVKPEKNSTASMAKVCKKSAGRLNCADLTITCTNGFNDGWTEQKALEAMCPTEVQAEQTRREKLKNDAESRFCKSGMKFEADCKANKVVFGCDEYSRRTPNEIERKLQNYCSATKTNSVEIQDETTQKRADKKADEEKLKNICENNGTKGKWNKTLKQCNCNEKNHIFDEETGCVAATKTFTEAQEKMKQLETQLNEKVTELNK